MINNEKSHDPFFYNILLKKLQQKFAGAFRYFYTKLKTGKYIVTIL